ncbi:hypothetical protein OB955_13865 [Halobacteria archaeon AArc-m2/3/4]|uniref:Uncharacterized protein n=1 Tax=Natronoglomus mannanivorans TaxID=2979990 RepID=A0AAP2Z194_9EURY|nr:hypothetical protein [Halobacteria archaeon AArc-xg1-1]MCU4973820.1 hypothetical protein [Halobacteria archaeon AArc-m2/3/4]
MHVCSCTTADDSTPTLGVLDDTIAPIDVWEVSLLSNRVAAL